MIKSLILGLAFLAFGASIYVAIGGYRPRQDALPATFKPLSVEQTLGLVFTNSEDVPMTHLYVRSNPSAAPYLRQILDDPMLSPYHPQAWAVLWYAGDESEVQRIAESIEDLNGVLSSDERSVLYSMITALGRLSYRKIAGAQELLERMEKIDYWRNADFQMYETPQANPQEFELIYDAVHADAYAEHPALGKRIQAILEEIEDPQARENLVTELNMEQLEEYHKAIHHVESQTPSPERMRDNLRMLTRNFNGDLQHPGPADRDFFADARAAGTLSPIAIRLRDQFQVTGISVEPDGTVYALNMQGAKITDEAVRLASQFPNLEGLSIGATSKVSNAPLAELADLQNLERFEIYSNDQITDPGLGFLEKLPRLQKVSLHHLSGINGDALVYVGEVPELRSLYLGHLRIDDSDLASLDGLEKLERLVITNAPIAGTGLRHLEGSKDLRELQLLGTNLDDAGLAQIERLKGLRHLLIRSSSPLGYQTTITEEGLERLRKALPECDVVSR